jgi:hypothetical protein
LSAGSGDVVSFTANNCGSLEELTARNEELEHKRKQVCTLRFELVTAVKIHVVFR